MPISPLRRPQVLAKLKSLYGAEAEGPLLARLDELADRFAELRHRDAPRWDEKSVLLITYGDQVSKEGEPPLATLHRFLTEHRWHEVIQAVHLLPFFPYSSDDGFSVIDYRQVDPKLGDWSDIHRLGESFQLAFDFVVNHCSAQNPWFQKYREGVQPYQDYFLEVDPQDDLSAVVRPRSSPLLTRFDTVRGPRWLWTTFSPDQVDLNLASPDLLVEVLEILFSYIEHGASIIRLDAIGFLWKRIGTSCMHLPETHTVVRLMRDLVDDVAPGTLLLTETNVPHAENVSYFGDGDEAHMVYQFSLAPLLLDAFLSADAGPLSAWLSQLEYPGAGMTFLNFTASHDGIGVRPLEGLVPPERLTRLVEAVRDRGGLVGVRRLPDGSDAPYELNITYFSALDQEPVPDAVQARRFLTSQAIALALRGIPAIYFHSLVATSNYREGVARMGQNRMINRRKFHEQELREVLADADSPQAMVFDGYRRLLEVRIAQPAFHPAAEQEILHSGCPAVLAFARRCPQTNQRIVVLANLGARSVPVDLGQLGAASAQQDLLSGRSVSAPQWPLAPYEVAWLIDR